MSDLLLEQENEINLCLKYHLIQISNSIEPEKIIDWRQIYGYLTLLLSYECFVFMIFKENQDTMFEIFNSLSKNFNQKRKQKHEIFKLHCDKLIDNLKNMLNDSSSIIYNANETTETVMEEGEIEIMRPMPIAKKTLKNFYDISNF